MTDSPSISAYVGDTIRGIWRRISLGGGHLASPLAQAGGAADSGPKKRSHPGGDRTQPKWGRVGAAAADTGAETAADMDVDPPVTAAAGSPKRRGRPKGSTTKQQAGRVPAATTARAQAAKAKREAKLQGDEGLPAKRKKAATEKVKAAKEAAASKAAPTNAAVKKAIAAAKRKVATAAEAVGSAAEPSGESPPKKRRGRLPKKRAAEDGEAAPKAKKAETATKAAAAPADDSAASPGREKKARAAPRVRKAAKPKRLRREDDDGAEKENGVRHGDIGSPEAAAEKRHADAAPDAASSPAKRPNKAPGTNTTKKRAVADVIANGPVTNGQPAKARRGRPPGSKNKKVAAQ